MSAGSEARCPLRSRAAALSYSGAEGPAVRASGGSGQQAAGSGYVADLTPDRSGKSPWK